MQLESDLPNYLKALKIVNISVKQWFSYFALQSCRLSVVCFVLLGGRGEEVPVDMLRALCSSQQKNSTFNCFMYWFGSKISFKDTLHFLKK